MIVLGVVRLCWVKSDLMKCWIVRKLGLYYGKQNRIQETCGDEQVC